MEMLQHPKVSDTPASATSSSDTEDALTSPSESDLREKYGRERGGYEYYDGKLNRVHVTSIPTTDAEAVAYFETVAGWTPEVKFVAGHPHTSLEYTLLPWHWQDCTAHEGVGL